MKTGNAGSVLLRIDTTDRHAVLVELTAGGRRSRMRLASRKVHAQQVLPLLESILAKQAVRLSDITEIQVSVGPGSFTGIRVGVAVATMLGMLLGIPVNGNPPGSPIAPRYDSSKFDNI